MDTNPAEVQPSEQSAESGETEKKEKQPALIIHEISADGSSQEIMALGEITEEDESEEAVNPSMVVEGVKGIAMTEEGFTPNVLTIPVGTKVVFQNAGTHEHWPDSEPKNGDPRCAEFDESRGVVPGESYEATFNEVKTCPFVDRLNRDLKGVIAVVSQE